MKKFFSLVLALVMALSLTTVAWGAYSGSGTGTAADPYQVTTAAELQEAVTYAGAYIKLMNNINGDGIVIDESVTIDLNEKVYTIDGNTVGDRHTNTLGMQILKDNTVTIMNGTIVGSDDADRPAMPGCPTSCAYCNGEADYGVKMVIQNYADLTLDGVTVTGNSKAGYVVSNNCGDVVIEDTTINAAAGKVAFDVCDYSTYTGVSVTVKGNSVINGKIELSDSNTGDSDVTKLVIENGEINGAIDVATSGMTEDVTISGGTFSVAPDEDYVAAGYRLVNGTVAAVPANTTGVVGGYEGMFTTVGATRQAITNLTKTLAVAPLDVDEDGYYNRPGDRIGSIEYYTLNFGGAVAQNYYRVDSVGDADLIVYVGDSKTPYMYLANEPAGGFTYVYGATVFNNFGKACGQFKYAAVDTTKTYYAYDGKVYVANPVGDVNLMVGGNFIQATDVTIAGTWVAHVPVYTQDKTGVVTAVKCANCPASAVIVANYACLPDAVKADDAYFNVPGSATKLFYWVDGVVVDTETKVESAETFDAGIAMYVGMSVMAAAGSAVVIGKKKD